MARQKKKANLPDFSEDELTILLRDYFLTTGDGPVGPVIKEIVKAWKFRWPLAVVRSLPPVTNVWPVLDALAITTHKARYRDGYVYIDPRQRRGSRRALVIDEPRMAARVCDFELLVPFFIERCLQRLSSRLWRRLSKVEGIFLLLLHHLFGGLDTMENFIERAIIDAEDGVVAVPKAWLEPDDFPYLLRRLMNTSQWLSAYVGVAADEGPDGRPLIPVSPHARSHWVNELVPRLPERQRRALRNEAQALGASDIVFPQLKVRQTFAVSSVGLAARNINTLTRIPPDGIEKRAALCLIMRLHRVKEPEIRRLLGFQEKADYIRFQSENHIDLAVGSRRDLPRGKDVVAKWESARKQLFAHRLDLWSQPFELFGQPSQLEIVEKKDGLFWVREGESETKLTKRETDIVRVFKLAREEGLSDIDFEYIHVQLYQTPPRYLSRLRDEWSHRELYYKIIEKVSKGRYRINPRYIFVTD